MHNKQWSEAIFESAIDGIIIINLHGIIHQINAAACTLFDYGKEELIGQNVNILMPFPHSRDHDDYMDRYNKTGQPKIIGVGREIEGKRKDGSLFPFQLSVSKTNIDGETYFVGFVHNLVDIYEAKRHIENLNKGLEKKVKERTQELEYVVNELKETNNKLLTEINDRRHAEGRLIESELRLKSLLDKEIELNNLKSRFMAMASHEFKTPLSTILLSSNLIGKYETTEENPKRIKHVERIKSSVGFLNGVLNDFLLLSRIESGKIKLKIEEFCIKELLIKVVDELTEIKKGNIKIRKTFVGETRKICSDKRIIKAILYNLVSNAVKFSGSSDHVDVSIDYNRPARIIVTDYGIGIPNREKHLIFSRFFRSSNATNIPGTGLGLNIVQHYLNVLGGRITFESKEGEGSSFAVHIPYNHKKHEA